MSQRHEHDTIERLWPGAADPNHPRFVPIELRDLVATIPAGVEKKIRREAYAAPEMFRTDGKGQKKTATISPADNEADFETAVVWLKINWARQQLAGEQRAIEQARRDAVGYTCRGCDQVVTPSALDRGRHTQRRRLPDGSSIVVCGKCAAVAEQLAVERLAADNIDGISRADRIRRLIAAATS